MPISRKIEDKMIESMREQSEKDQFTAIDMKTFLKMKVSHSLEKLLKVLGKLVYNRRTLGED